MARQPSPDPDAALYTPEEVGILFRVDTRTVTRWDQAGKFPSGTVIRTPGRRTPGRHRRYRGEYIRSLLNGGAK